MIHALLKVPKLPAMLTLRTTALGQIMHVQRRLTAETNAQHSPNMIHVLLIRHVDGTKEFVLNLLDVLLF